MTTSPYAHLPEPVRAEDLRTSLDVESHPSEQADAFREAEWLLRGGASG
jgi:hypothetical protein